MFIDAAISDTTGPILEDLYSSRKGNWYIVLTARDAKMKDCLHPDYPNREKVIQYLRNLRKEYLNTHNYAEVHLKK